MTQVFTGAPLSFTGFSTIKLPLSHHKNRFNPDICNFIADFEG